MTVDKAKGVKLIVLDVDGTLTDGKIFMDSSGAEMKAFNVKDGMAISQGGKYGLKFAIITGRESVVVERRAKELGITEVHQKVSNKIEVLNGILEREGITYEQVGYMGDDINDIPAMKRSGFNGIPADACIDIIKYADFEAKNHGGEGAVREFIEFIMRAQGTWEKVVEDYENKR